MAKEDRPDVQIFMALLDSNLWRPSDSGRRVALDWLHSVARHTFSNNQEAEVHERREVFRAALALEDTESPKHPSQVILSAFTGLLSLHSLSHGLSKLLLVGHKMILLHKPRKSICYFPKLAAKVAPVAAMSTSCNAEIRSRPCWSGLARCSPEVSLCFPVMARQGAGSCDVRYYASQ